MLAPTRGGEVDRAPTLRWQWHYSKQCYQVRNIAEKMQKIVETPNTLDITKENNIKQHNHSLAT